MAPVSLPPGFRFHPSDEELISYYLKRKVLGQKTELDIIPEVDLYKCEPWDLPNKSFLPNRDLEWYFFSPRDRKYPNGSRTNRATTTGYWKATGKDRKIISQLAVIGMKKTLVFYEGRAPQGRRTDWVMHEYLLSEMQCEGAAGRQDAFVLCRVIKKNVTEQKSGEQSGTQMQNSYLSSPMNNSFPEKITSLGAGQGWTEKSYPQVRQEESCMQENLALPAETSSESLNVLKEFEADIICFMDFNAQQNCISGSPSNFRNGLKVNSMFESARIQEDNAHQMVKVENFSFSVGDARLNMPGSPGTEKMDEPSEEADILEEILNAAQASQACNTLEHSFSLDVSTGNLFREYLLENSVPSMGDSYEISFPKEQDSSPCEDIYAFQECLKNSTWNVCQEILPCQVEGELKDIGSATLRRELSNLCRWQYKYSPDFPHSLDYYNVEGCSNDAELYS